MNLSKVTKRSGLCLSFAFAVMVPITTACGRSADLNADASATELDSAKTVNPNEHWGADGTGCPLRTTNLPELELRGSTIGTLWDNDVSISLDSTTVGARAYSSTSMTTTNQGSRVTPTAANTASTPVFVATNLANVDVVVDTRRINSQATRGRLCIDGLRGDIRDEGLYAKSLQTVVYTDVRPATRTLISANEAWIFINTDSAFTLDARSFNADVSISSDLTFTGINSGGSAEGTLGNGPNTMATLIVTTDGPIHIERDKR